MKDSGARGEALQLFPALKDIEPELEVYASLLQRWQMRMNLVSERTLGDLWLRHFADSAQVHAAAPEVLRWADIGSGAGFPGLITALLLKRRTGARVHLIESDQRKAAFLRAVSRETAAPTEVHAERIESALPRLARDIDGVSARALAPFDRLLRLAEEPLKKGAIGVFLKGEDWREELTAAGRLDNFTVETAVSRTLFGARVVLVKHRTAQN